MSDATSLSAIPGTSSRFVSLYCVLAARYRPCALVPSKLSAKLRSKPGRRPVLKPVSRARPSAWFRSEFMGALLVREGPLSVRLVLVAVLLLTPPALLASNTPALCFRNAEIGQAVPDCSVLKDDATIPLTALTSDRVTVVLFIRGTQQRWRDAMRDVEWACSGHSQPIGSLALLSKNGSMEEVSEFVETEGLKLEVLREVDCFSAFGAIASPSVALVDDGGTLVYAHPGYRSGFGDSLRTSIELLLDGKLNVTPEERGSEEFYEGLRMKEKGRVREALPLLEQAAARKPGFADGRFHLGILLIETGRLKDGIAELEAVVDLAPDHKPALEKLGEAYFLLGELDKSQAALEKFLDLSPRSFLSKALLAGVFVEKGLLEEAQAQAEAAMALNPGLPLAHYWLGRIYEAQGELDEAVQEYQSALESILNEAH